MQTVFEIGAPTAAGTFAPVTKNVVGAMNRKAGWEMARQEEGWGMGSLARHSTIEQMGRRHGVGRCQKWSKSSGVVGGSRC